MDLRIQSVVVDLAAVGDELPLEEDQLDDLVARVIEALDRRRDETDTRKRLVAIPNQARPGIRMRK